MKESNIHPIFEKILSGIAPSKEDAFTELEKMHRAALRANTSLMRGYSLLLAALNMNGMNRETLRQIMANAIDDAAKEMDYKNATHQE